MTALDQIRATALVPFGYAPGGYMVRCANCAEKFVGDKRAVRCESCAERTALKSAIDTVGAKFVLDVEAASAARVVYLLAEMDKGL